MTTLAAGACSDDAGEGGGRVGPLVVAAGPNTSGEDADISGRLVRPEPDACIGLASAGGTDRPTGLVWPPGTTWSGEDGAIVVDGTTFTVGDEVRGAGGHHSADGPAGPELTADVLAAVRDCGWDDFANLDRLD